jgi:activator of 2-hydroxyglutaryl-CoA dehydratase
LKAESEKKLGGLHPLGKSYYLGVDVGSVSTNIVVIDENQSLCARLYLKTGGQPAQALKNGLTIIERELGKDVCIRAAGATEAEGSWPEYLSARML